MAEQSRGDVTRLLRAWGSGKPEVRDELFALVYDELRSMAAMYLRKERPDHTLQATALVSNPNLMGETTKELIICPESLLMKIIARGASCVPYPVTRA